MRSARWEGLFGVRKKGPLHREGKKARGKRSFPELLRMSRGGVKGEFRRRREEKGGKDGVAFGCRRAELARGIVLFFWKRGGKGGEEGDPGYCRIFLIKSGGGDSTCWEKRRKDSILLCRGGKSGVKTEGKKGRRRMVNCGPRKGGSAHFCL